MSISDSSKRLIGSLVGRGYRTFTDLEDSEKKILLAQHLSELPPLWKHEAFVEGNAKDQLIDYVVLLLKKRISQEAFLTFFTDMLMAYYRLDLEDIFEEVKSLCIADNYCHRVDFGYHLGRESYANGF